MPARNGEKVGVKVGVNKDRKAAVVPRRPRAHSPEREVCPKCGRATARLIGRSEIYPVLYLRCDDCSHTSVAPA